MASEPREATTKEPSIALRGTVSMKKASKVVSEPTNEGPAAFYCHSCSRTCPKYSELVRHYAGNHFKTELTQAFIDDPTSLVCKICQNTLSKRSLLFGHFATVHKALEGKIPDKAASRKFSLRVLAPLSPMSDASSARTESKVELQGERPEVEEKSSFSCHLCRERRKSAESLLFHCCREHYQQELAEKMDLDSKCCLLCQSTFKKTGSLFSHLVRVHKLLKDDLPTELTQAMPKKLKASQDSRKAYVCHVCGKPSSSYSDILSHMARHHFKDDVDERFATDGSHACSVCGCQASSLSNLYRHLAVKHDALEGQVPARSDLLVDDDDLPKKENSTAAEIYKCPVCLDYRASFAQLKLHLAVAHYKQHLVDRYGMDDDTKSCPVCQKTVENLISLLAHLAGKHDALDEEIPPKEDLLVQDSSPKKVTKTKNKRLFFRCDECHVVRDSYGGIKVHYARIHLRKQMVRIYWWK